MAFQELNVFFGWEMCESMFPLNYIQSLYVVLCQNKQKQYHFYLWSLQPYLAQWLQPIDLGLFVFLFLVVVIVLLRYAHVIEKHQNCVLNTASLSTGWICAAGLMMVGNFQVGNKNFIKDTFTWRAFFVTVKKKKKQTFQFRTLTTAVQRNHTLLFLAWM